MPDPPRVVFYGKSFSRPAQELTLGDQKIHSYIVPFHRQRRNHLEGERHAGLAARASPMQEPVIEALAIPQAMSRPVKNHPRYHQQIYRIGRNKSVTGGLGHAEGTRTKFFSGSHFHKFKLPAMHARKKQPFAKAACFLGKKVGQHFTLHRAVKGDSRRHGKLGSSQQEFLGTATEAPPLASILQLSLQEEFISDRLFGHGRDPAAPPASL
jgi:hypothetical protein